MATATKERPERIATNVQSRGGSSPGAKSGASGDDSAGKRKGKSMKVKIIALLVLLLVGGAVAKFTGVSPLLARIFRLGGLEFE